MGSTNSNKGNEKREEENKGKKANLR